MPNNLTVRAVRGVGVEVPTTYVLGTSRGAISRANLVLIDLETEAGITGRAYVFSHMPDVSRAIIAMLSEVERVTKGDPVAPLDLYARLHERFALIGVQGIIRMALAGFDVAAWDALAISQNLPLARLLGATPRPIPAYNSCGLGLMAEPEQVADEAEKLLGGNFRAVKLRLGYPTLKQDIAAVRAVKKRIGENLLMTDYNQALSLTDALERGRALDDEGLYWLEEPIRHDDYAGNAALRHELKVPIQIGENFSLPEGMEVALDAGASDWVMPDLERIGGVTGCMRAAALSAARRIAMSSHLFPEVSAHLLAATPTAHWLEYVDWMDTLVQEPLRIVDGCAVVSGKPGNGLVWDQKAAERYRVV
jgi:mandelate racemase